MAMRKLSIAGLLVLCMLVHSCTEKQNVSEAVYTRQELSAEQIANGVMTPEVLWMFGRLSGTVPSPDGTRLLYGVTRYDETTNKSVRDAFTLDLNGGEAVKITASDGRYNNLCWNPADGRIAYLSNESGKAQIWEMDPDGSEHKQVSHLDGDINSFAFSPDGTRILFTMDVKIEKTPAEVYPDLPLANVRIIDDLMYRHWDHWSDYSCSHIFWAPYENESLGEATDIMKDEPWDAPLSPYFDATEISWSPDASSIAYTCKKMKGKEYALSTNSDIYVYDLASGNTTNITKDMPGYDKYPAWSPDGKMIAWQSMKTPGYESDKDRLFIINLETGEKKNMSTDFDQDAGNLVWNNDGTMIYFLSGIHATYQVYVLDVNDGSIRQITSGRHDYTSISLAGDRIIGERMAMDMATEVYSVDPATGKESQLTFTNRDIYDHIRMGKVEERWIKTTDDKDMLVWIIYPPDFNPDRKYPALLYCQGGPQSAVSQFFSYRWNFQMMAANDYIVVAPNRRGLPTFGTKWNEQISGDYGGQNMKDYLSAIDEVSKENYIDKDRLGAVGASYGGYSVFWLAGHHDGRFKAFIAHCGIFNLESMYASTEEMFFVNHDLGGPFWEDPRPKSYEFSPHLYVQKWDTPIMIITSGYDFRVPYTQSLQAFDAAQLRGIPSKLLYFPKESHFVTQPQNAILWQREFFGWLDRWLKEGS